MTTQRSYLEILRLVQAGQIDLAYQRLLDESGDDIELREDIEDAILRDTGRVIS